MQLDLSNVEQDVESLIDAALAAVPGNPIVLAPVERAVVHAVLTGVVHLVDAKLTANAPNSAYPPVQRPAETTAGPTWLQRFGARLEGIFAPAVAAQTAAAAMPAAQMASQIKAAGEAQAAAQAAATAAPAPAQPVHAAA